MSVSIFSIQHQSDLIDRSHHTTPTKKKLLKD